MSTKKAYNSDNKQLDIVDEAIDLMEAAGSEVCEMTFADALEVMKIERLDMLRKELNLIVGRINVAANAIHDKH